MIVLDFLIYHITKYYDGRRDKLSWSTPLEMAIYVVGLVTILWLFVVEEVICFFIIKTRLKIFPLFLVVVVGLLIMQIYNYIYIKKSRFDLLEGRFESTISERTGVTLAILFVFFSFCLPYAIFMIFT